jgi:hypothetical protein
MADNALTIPWRWISTQCQPSTIYEYPSPVNPFFRRAYSGPRVYRWAVFESDVLTAADVGEAEDLCRRLGGYLNPGAQQRTNIRIKHCLDEKKLAGATIRLQMLEFDDFRINGLAFSCDSLTNPYTRKCLENLAVALHTSDCTLLNRGTDLIDKALKKIAERIPDSKPGARETFIRSAQELIRHGRSGDAAADSRKH